MWADVWTNDWMNGCIHPSIHDRSIDPSIDRPIHPWSIHRPIHRWIHEWIHERIQHALATRPRWNATLSQHLQLQPWATMECLMFLCLVQLLYRAPERGFKVCQSYVTSHSMRRTLKLHKSKRLCPFSINAIDIRKLPTRCIKAASVLFLFVNQICYVGDPIFIWHFVFRTLSYCRKRFFSR